MSPIRMLTRDRTHMAQSRFPLHITRRVVSILLFFSGDWRTAVVPGASERLETEAAKVNVHVINLMNPSVNKGEGLKRLAEELGIPVSAVVAFGDGKNDLEFLADAGLGIAMNNARPQTRAAAARVTRFSNDEDGVARTVAELQAEGTLPPPRASAQAQERWLDRWQQTLDDWWLALPKSSSSALERCALFLGGVLSQRLNAWARALALNGRGPNGAHLSAAASSADAPAPDASPAKLARTRSCEEALTHAEGALPLPDFPEVPEGFFDLSADPDAHHRLPNPTKRSESGSRLHLPYLPSLNLPTHLAPWIIPIPSLLPRELARGGGFARGGGLARGGGHISGADEMRVAAVRAAAMPQPILREDVHASSSVFPKPEMPLPVDVRTARHGVATGIGFGAAGIGFAAGASLAAIFLIGARYVRRSGAPAERCPRVSPRLPPSRTRHSSAAASASAAWTA